MRAAKWIVIVVALVFAGLTAYLTQLYLSRNAHTVAKVEESPKEVLVAANEILVATADLPAGTILSKNHWRWQPWPDKSIDKSYIVRRAKGKSSVPISEISGAAVKRGIGLGEPITRGKIFKRDEPGFLAGTLKPGMRAVGIQVNAVSSAAGFILPGDRVDIILTQQVKGGGTGSAKSKSRAVSETILKNIRVLAIDQLVDDIKKTAKVGKTATIEVTPKQAEMLALAARMGRLSLALRSLVKGKNDTLVSGVTSDLDVSEFIRQNAEDDARAENMKLDRMPRDPNGAVRVLVAGRDLDAGELLRDGHLRWQTLPKGASTEGMFVEGNFRLAELRGALLGSKLATGAPLKIDTVTRPDTPGFLSAALAPGRRAVSLGKKTVANLSGFASAGDHVDVVLTRRVDTGSGIEHTSDTVMEGVRILALDRKRSNVALEVTPQQAAALTVIEKMGDVSLLLRGDMAGNRSTADTSVHMPDLRVSRAGPAPANPAAPVTARRNGRSEVTLYRGTSGVQLQFKQ